tara:strand:- start:285 stop:1178 length:894 start_codon:yes stop_codon:yes gene_type:complete
MQNEVCYLCGSVEKTKIGHTNCDRKIPVLKCTKCELVFLESFDHITDDYYYQAGMRTKEMNPHERNDLNCEKFNEWRKATESDDLSRYERLKGIMANKDVLDFGAGNAGFLKFALESGTPKSVTAIELDYNARENMEKDNIPSFENLSLLPPNTKFDIITSFHVLEHLKDPISTMQELAAYLHVDGVLLMEFPNADDALISLYKSKEFSEFTYRNDHLFLLNVQNAQQMVEKANLTCNKVVQIQRFPLANHLYWLSHGLPRGQEVWSFLDSSDLNEKYKKHLANIGACDTIMIEVQK